MKTTISVLASLAGFFSLGLPIAAQTIQVDITPAHATNHFVPNETLGAGVDRIPQEAIDKGLTQPALGQALSSGWQPVTYRQNTELAVEAWHWNPQGTWSDPAGKGYFTGSSNPTEFLRYSYGYSLPHRGFTRNDGTDNVGFSRLTDGDASTYWKSNPYLTERFTGENDSLHPQWIVVDLAQVQQVNSIQINWAAPYAVRYAVQYWTGDDPIKAPTHGIWQTFPDGVMAKGQRRFSTLQLATAPLAVRYLRVLMTESSDTCDSHGSADPRNCVGYAIDELYIGTTTADGKFHDVVRHTPDQEQTTTYCSSVDPWHEPSDLHSTEKRRWDSTYFSRAALRADFRPMIPVALLYDTPDNAAAEIAYCRSADIRFRMWRWVRKRMGNTCFPEDYAALYVQWAAALHRVNPTLKLGGPFVSRREPRYRGLARCQWQGFLDRAFPGLFETAPGAERPSVFFIRALSLRPVPDSLG